MFAMFTQVSGIIAIYITALFMGNLAWKNLSAGARYHHQVILGALGLLVATYNFALLGSSLYFVVSQGSWNWQLIWTVLGVAYTVRLAVLPVGMLLTHWHRGTPLDYHIYYPKECLPPLSTEETEVWAFNWALVGDKLSVGEAVVVALGVGTPSHTDKHVQACTHRVKREGSCESARRNSASVWTDL